jgi:hypothetical protein
MKTKRFCLTELAKLKSSLQQVEANATPNLLRGCREFIREKFVKNNRDSIFLIFTINTRKKYLKQYVNISESSVQNISFEPHGIS